MKTTIPAIATDKNGNGCSGEQSSSSLNDCKLLLSGLWAAKECDEMRARVNNINSVCRLILEFRISMQSSKAVSQYIPNLDWRLVFEFRSSMESSKAVYVYSGLPLSL
uniref:Uncharacterized protein n=1 Tax=Glossina palpalis gambiensis TaxID=67801 RepID=A0A1B0AM02_9MUSC